MAQGYRGPAYQVVSNDANGLEIRFHGVGLRGVHADDSQNALAIDFQQPVDGAETGTVVEVYQCGYRLNDSVIRPARVVVAV